MTKTVKLYDLRKRDYPNKRGGVFRSLQVFECWVCGALSNKVIMGGYPGYGIRCVCPNSSECWHHEIEEKIKWLHNPHPKKYRDELQKEIEAMKFKIKSKIQNDIKGNPNTSLKRSMTNTFSYKPGSECAHHI